MIKKHTKLELFDDIIRSWKPRCKKIKFRIIDLGKDAKVSWQQISRIINNHSVSTIKTINKIEMALRAAEKRAGSNVKK